MRRIQAAVGAAIVLAGGEAAGHPCEAVEEGVIQTDAMLDDWRGFRALRRGQTSPDASLELRCAFDAEALHVAVRVRDDTIIRTGPRGRGQDALELALRAGTALAPWKLTFHPGTRGFRASRIGGAGAAADDSLREDGWQLELSVPLARIPGWGSSTPLLLADLSYTDIDRAGSGAEELRSREPLDFSTHLAGMQGFLSATGLSPADFRLDALVDMDVSPGTERVVAGGKYVAVLTDSFAFLELPIGAPDDLQRAELVDFDGDGRPSLLVQFREHGGGGSREVVAVIRLAPGGTLERVLAFEVGLSLGGRKLVNRWSLVPRVRGRRGRGRGIDIHVEVGPGDNTGWDQASFARITPSPDARPILTPWSDRRSLVYTFDGDTALEERPRR